MRGAARKDGKLRFTALLHHITPDLLRESFLGLRKTAAVGVAGVTWLFFVDEVTRHWLRVIRRRSQRGRSRWTWARMQRLGRKHLPRPHIIHPYPEQRFRARLKAGAV